MKYLRSITATLMSLIGLSASFILLAPSLAAEQNSAATAEPAQAQAAIRTLTERSKLLPSPLAAFDEVGWSLSLSDNRALVGVSRRDFYSGGGAGSAFVFAFNGVTWNQEAELKPSDSQAGDGFGFSVSLKSNRALIGAFGNNGLQGAAYIFEFNGASWAQTAELRAADSAPNDGNLFGNAVSLSGDRALIGRVFDSTYTTNSGAAYTFTFNGATWAQEAKINTTDDSTVQFRNFGIALSLSGHRALIGSVEGENLTGAAYIFDFVGATWTQKVRLTSSSGLDKNFSGNVALDGNRALMGCDDYRDGSYFTGVGYLYHFDDTAWSLETKLTPADSLAYEQFTPAVALEGKSVLIGISRADQDAIVSYFGYKNGTWKERANLVPSDPVTDAFNYFGVSVSLSGNRALVGAPFSDQHGLQTSGASYLYAFPR